MEHAHGIADWDTLLDCLPSDYEVLADEHKQINRQWPNAKVQDAKTLLRFVFAHVGADLPLRQTVVAVGEAGGPKLSAVRLHLRMRRAHPYLAALVSRMLPASVEVVPERWDGYDLVLTDASAICGPGAEGTDARLHVVIRVADLRVLQVEVTGVEGGETLRRFHWERNQLVIGDRGYSNGRGIASVVADEADALVRFNSASMPLVCAASGAEVDVLGWCRALQGHRATELDVITYWRDGRERRELRGRLIGIRLPDEDASSARDWVRREHGANASAEQLEQAGYILLFTTAPVGRLSAARAVEAYRLRWQIELQFKRWKSLCRFDRLPNYRDDTIKSWLTGKLLLGLVVDRIGAQALPTADHSSQPATAMARNPWKLTNLIWAAMLAALMPIGLNRVVNRVPQIVAALDACDSHLEQRQLTLFRKLFPADRNPEPHCKC